MTKPIGLGNMSSSFNDFNVLTSWNMQLETRLVV